MCLKIVDTLRAVLNKSAVVLITACFEALVEDVAEQGFDFLLTNASDYKTIPKRVRVYSSKSLRDADDESQVWELAGDGWKKTLRKHKTAMVKRYIGRLHSPTADNVDALYSALLDIKVSRYWNWPGMSAPRAKEKLRDFVKHRGAIAHRVSAATPTTKAYVEEYKAFAMRLAVITSNCVAARLLRITGKDPWSFWKFGSVV